MPFKITIEETKTRLDVVGKDWRIIGEEYQVGQEKPRSIYGYTPMIEKPIPTTTKIYEQTVEELNIAALVCVINNIDRKVDPGYTVVQVGEAE